MAEFFPWEPYLTTVFWPLLRLTRHSVLRFGTCRMTPKINTLYTNFFVFAAYVLAPRGARSTMFYPTAHVDRLAVTEHLVRA